MKGIRVTWPLDWPTYDGQRIQVKVGDNTVVNESTIGAEVPEYAVDWVADKDYEVKIFARLETEEYATHKTVTFHTPPNLSASGSGGSAAAEVEA